MLKSEIDLLPPATNFDGIEIKPNPGVKFNMVLCPKCHGYGEWNLRLDAYGKGKHFQAQCNQCNGWGWVKKGSMDEKCVHEYKYYGMNNGMGEQLWQCVKCGRETLVDASD